MTSEAAVKPSVDAISSTAKPKPAVNILLWTLQGLLAAEFLLAGAVKFVVPIEKMAAQVQMSGGFLHFIGVMEILGALGMLLPGIFKVQRRLTPLAAAGLVIIMIGATWITWRLHGFSQASAPLVVGLFALCVLYGRRSWLTQA